VALHVDATLHVERVVDVLQDSGQPCIQHRRRCAPTDIKRGERPVADNLAVAVDLLQNSICITFRNGCVKEFFVVGTIGTDLATEGNMEIEPQALDSLKVGSKRKRPALQSDFLLVEQSLRHLAAQPLF
jgi:hypothetical protein